MPEYTITISIHGGVGSLDAPDSQTLAPGDALTVNLIDYDVDTIDDEVQLDADGDPYIEVDALTLTVTHGPDHQAVKDAIRKHRDEIKQEIRHIELTQGEDEDALRTNFLHGQLYGLRDALRFLNNPQWNTVDPAAEGAFYPTCP